MTDQIPLWLILLPGILCAVGLYLGIQVGYGDGRFDAQEDCRKTCVCP